MTSRGNLIVLSGPSGAGKSTVVSLTMAQRDDLCFSTSVTTREPRPGEKHGREYYFINQDAFNDLVRRDALLEYATYVEHSYGTPREYVEDKLSRGINVILDIEVQGARQVKQRMPDAIAIFLMPPSLKELRRRLEGRCTDSAEVIDARIDRARDELAEADFYDYFIVNNDAALAADEFSAIITAERCRFNSAVMKQFLERDLIL